MNMRVCFLLLIAACVGRTADLPTALAARMDETARGLKSFSADLKEIDHTAIVNDDTALSGTFRMRRVKPGGTRLMIEYRGTDARTIAFEGERAQIYLPKIN